MCDYPRIIYMNKIKIFAHFMYVCMYVCMTAPSYAELICSNCFSYNTTCYVCGNNSPCNGSPGHNCHTGYGGCSSGVQYVNDGATYDPSWVCDSSESSWCRSSCSNSNWISDATKPGVEYIYKMQGCLCDEITDEIVSWRCGAGYYAIPNYGARCERCPEHSTSEPGSMGQDSCKCDANYYMDNGMCVACPDGATSDVGAVGVSACKCPVGTYRYDSRCQECPALIENPGADWGPMPDATTSGIGAENITDCYIPASSQYEDNTGYFTYDADCSYKTSP